MNLLYNLNALSAGLFLICTFGIVSTRQIRAVLKFFIFQSIFLSVSAFIIGYYTDSFHLIFTGIINFSTKVVILPILIRVLIPEELYTKREITHTLNIPTSLIISIVLTVFAYFVTFKVIKFFNNDIFIGINTPIGFTGMLIGAFTLIVRREALAQLIGLLSMENSVFFLGISIAKELNLFTEIAASFDLIVLTFVIILLTGKIHEKVGSTSVKELTSLKEEEN